MEYFARGAEAVIRTHEGSIHKIREPKAYRHPALDILLRNSRTKREVAILSKCPVPVPKVISHTQDTIVMSKLSGSPLRDLLNQKPQLGLDMGSAIATLHDANIIHGDLTTSNMLYDGKLALLDFGLAYTSTRIEDKAVDLHVLLQALESTHYTVKDQVWSAFLITYKPNSCERILEQLARVEKRGRNKC